MRKFIFLLWIPFSVFGQNTIGFPEVINYSNQAYRGGLQNWDIRQDKNGIMYFANNEGLLSFDGRFWNLYPLPNKTIVRSVEIGADNRIFVGGQDELGYFTPGHNGRLEYHSLTPFIPEKHKSFGDVWDIVTYKKDIYFRTASKIFRFVNESVAVFAAPSEWAFLGTCNGRLYAQDYRLGLMGFDNQAWHPLGIVSELPVNDPVTAILPAPGDKAVVTTLKNGLFQLSFEKIAKIQSPNSQVLENERIYAATLINSNWIALATNNGGIYIVDLHENLIQRFSRTEGLQNNNVLSIFLDNQQNLWLGLDNGIDFIAYNSAIKHIMPMMQDGSGYAAIIHDKDLYLGTSSGLYTAALQPVKDLSFSRGSFTPVDGAQGQNWSLAEINNQLLLGHHEGAFQVQGSRVHPLSSLPGFWNFTPITSTLPAARMVAGNYNGLTMFDFRNNQFVPVRQLPGFTESSRFVAIDQLDNIWVSHPYHGVYKIIRTEKDSCISYSYNNKKGLPSTLNNHVYKIRNEVVIATQKGVYAYNAGSDLFEPSKFYRKILGDQSIRYLKEDVAGNIWFIHEKTLGVIDMTGREPVVIYMPELNNKMLSGFEFIYSVDENNVFLGGEKGFYHINYEKYKRNLPDLKVQVRAVRIINDHDSLLFGGYFRDVNEKQVQDEKDIPGIAYDWKSIHFEFSSSLFAYQASLEYSYLLKGFDEGWSAWTKRNEKEYTNLPAGGYTFEVKVRNNLGNESPVSGYSFKVLPPWYQTALAKLIYLLLFCLALLGLYRWQRKKFLQQQQLFEEEQQKILYIHELERSKTENELVALRNEKLEAEINYKNSEMASSAMHLVKKGELLAKIKAELTLVMKKLKDEQAIAELKKMVKTLGEDDNIDKEWENFAKHFDKVNSDFVMILKEKHPTITGNELKLCTYLRMNLATKEIAQLMSISVRGVEISRYRLRKKLGISSEVNLFDYLINLNNRN